MKYRKDNIWHQKGWYGFSEDYVKWQLKNIKDHFNKKKVILEKEIQDLLIEQTNLKEQLLELNNQLDAQTHREKKVTSMTGLNLNKIGLEIIGTLETYRKKTEEQKERMANEYSQKEEEYEKNMAIFHEILNFLTEIRTHVKR